MENFRYDFVFLGYYVLLVVFLLSLFIAFHTLKNDATFSNRLKNVRL